MRTLLNSDLRNQAQDGVVRDIVEFAFVFFLEAFAKKFGGDETGFAVGQVAAGLIAKRGECGVREADDERAVFYEKFCVDGVGMARGNAVPHVREAAAIVVAGEFRLDVKDADGALRYVLELSSPSLEPLVLYIDPRTSLISKQAYVVRAPGQPLIEELLSDYRLVNGVNVAFTAEVRAGGRPVVKRRLNTITFNAALDPKLFTRPVN